MILPLIAAQITVPQLAAFQLEAWARVAIERVINSLPEGVLIALFAWAVLRVLPGQNSRTRFAVWFMALLGMAGLPWFDGLSLGGFTFAGLNARIFGASRMAPQATAPAIALPAHWAPIVFLVWLAIAGIAMTRLALSLWHLRALRRSCTAANTADLDPSISQTIAELNAAKSFASRPVTLATSACVRVPAALGLWEPMIALPVWALAELPPSELSIILRHEFAHLRRWDDWTNLLQKIVRAVFFFHPAVWWIENRLSVEREMACDDIVVAQTGNPMGYANCLVSLLERSLAQRGWTMAQAIVHRAREASLRLAQILDKNRPAATGVSKPALGLVGTFAVLCVAMVPQTPELVAFDRHPLAPQAEQEYSAALVHPALLRTDASLNNWRTGVPVRPAAKTGELRTPQRLSRRTSPKSIPAHSVTTRKDVANSTVPPHASLLIEASAAVADQNFHPMLQTLVFVEATQFVPAPDEGPDSVFAATATPMPVVTLLRVQVWRVTFVSLGWESSTRVPVANKI